MNRDSESELMAYGRALMAHVTHREAGIDPPWVQGFLDLLRSGSPTASADPPLQSIFTLIRSDAASTDAGYLRAMPLSLTADAQGNWDWEPVALAAALMSDRGAVYREFAQADAPETTFLRFFHLMRKYASSLPNTYGEPGVSLFEQWKMVAALVTISGSTKQPPQTLGLVGGDIPGIQRTISTVTSKGAAKAMRGRSAFIQLLGHALVERLQSELGLGPANVVYDAGGNFVLLTGWTEGAGGTQEKVRAVANQVNTVLLAGLGKGRGRFDGFHGDLGVALAAMSITPHPQRLPVSSPLDVLRCDLPLIRQPDGRDASAWQMAEKWLKDQVAAAKNRPFGDLAQESDAGWRSLFGPDPAETDEFCAVCRRPKNKGETFRLLELEGEGNICPECESFNKLANDLGHRAPRLTLSVQAPPQPQPWQSALHAVCGRWYAIGGERQADDIVLALNMDDFPAPGVEGFRLLAHTTPMTGAQIKTNEELADASRSGMKRLGVLRMDVDNLGDLIVRGLPARTAMQTAELSQALERFFAGWLGQICAQVGEDLLYVLYAGGDDLLVVGPWTHMPKLAQAIHDDFVRYTCEHCGIHVSAGIAVVGEKTPLYAGADESHDALQAAKAVDSGTPLEKNAITFLGYTAHWEQFKEATGLMDDIVALAVSDELGNAVITRLQAIAQRFYRDRQRGPYAVKGKFPQRGTDAVFYGPWMWRQAYALARLREGRSDDVAKKLRELERALLQGQIVNLGLAARWAQLGTRGNSQG